MNNTMPTWPGWETVRLIGRGSFGAVYEIERDMLGETEKAALKVITIPQSSSDIDELYGEGYDDESITSTFKEHLKNIVAEYSLMRKLNGSANVVNCDDVRYVQHNDGIGWDIFIKMELLTPLTKALGKEVTEEQVIERNPNYIVSIAGMGDTAVEEILGRAGWGDISAVKNAQVFNADSNAIARPGPRLKDAAIELYNFLNGAEAQEVPAA